MLRRPQLGQDSGAQLSSEAAIPRVTLTGFWLCFALFHFLLLWDRFLISITISSPCAKTINMTIYL